MTLTHRLCAALGRRGDGLAYVTLDGQTLSGLRLRDTVLKLAHALAERGVTPGQIVFPVVDNRDLRLFLILAGVMAGARSLTAGDLTSSRAAQIEPDWIVAFADQDVDHGRVLRFDASWLSGPAPAAPGGGGLIVTSSGSTGLTKFMAVPEVALDRWVVRTQAMLSPDFGLRLITVPVTGAFGLSYLLEPLLDGQAVMGARPSLAETLGAAADAGAAEVLAALAILDDIVSAREQGVRCPDFRRILFGGAAANPALLRRARAAFPQAILTVCIGATETGFFGAGDVDVAHAPAGWSGYPAADVEVALRDVGMFAELDPQAGRLAVRVVPDVRVEGYLNAGPAYDPEGWFETGDIARLTDDGAMVLLARADFLINLGGAKFAPDLIEVVAATAPGVAQVAAAQAPDGLGVLVVPGPGFDAQVLHTHLTLGLSIAAGIAIQTVATLPHLANGKLDRMAIRQAFGG